MKQQHSTLIVGVGSIGERHVRCMLSTGRATVSICEANHGVRERVAASYNIDSAFPTIDKAFTRRWDSVVIATPAPSHIALALRAIEAGAGSILLEKPLDVSDESAPLLIDAATTSGVVIGVAYVYRAHPALRAMRQAIVDGQFGTPLHVVGNVGQNFPTYRPAYASTYYASHDSGGGAIQDALTHLLNAGEWLVGPISKIAVDAAHLRLPGVDVEDTVNAMARHGDVLASYSLNQHQPPNEWSITVTCTQGAARFNLAEHTWSWMTTPDTAWNKRRFELSDRDTWFTHQSHAWLDAVEGRSAPLCTLSEGLQTLRVNLAALESMRNDSAWVHIANEKEAVLERA